MNLFADLLASTTGSGRSAASSGGAGMAQGSKPKPLVETGPRIQKSRRGVEVKSAREI